MTDPAQRKLFNTSAMTSTAAMRRHRRPAMEEPYKKVLAMFPKVDEIDLTIELNLSDEDRLLTISLKRCPHCSCCASLQRVKKNTKMFYRVRCNDIANCGNTTDFFKSSAEAIRVWKMASLLTK